jgi:hypothetical protein
MILKKKLELRSVVLQATVNKYYRLALAELNIGKLSAVGGNSLKFIGHGHGNHGSANYESS